MREPTEPRLSKWAFFVGDVIFLGGAYFIFQQSKLPMGVWQMAFVVVCVAGGACLGILPFLLEYRLRLKLAEMQTLTTVAAQFKNLEAIAAQIVNATGRWNSVQEEAEKVATTAKGIADKMNAEVQAFTDFLQKANDGEKATLRLEAEKLRRGEAEWIQVIVRMLDHVHALYSGAVRSGQPNLIAQLTNFQAACRDAARRVGLTPFTPGAAEPFDSQRHQLLDGENPPAAGATVGETVATGYTFQGRLLRPAIVRLTTSQASSNPEAPANPKAELDRTQGRLALDEARS